MSGLPEWQVWFSWVQILATCSSAWDLFSFSTSQPFTKSEHLCSHSLISPLPRVSLLMSCVPSRILQTVQRLLPRVIPRTLTLQTHNFCSFSLQCHLEGNGKASVLTVSCIFMTSDDNLISALTVLWPCPTAASISDSPGVLWPCHGM